MMDPPPGIGRLLHESRRLQGEVADRVIGPVDGVFDLFAQSATALREQAEALEQAGRALERSAALMKHQAVLFERAVETLRQPTDVARAISGAPQRRSPGD